jgi:hypothetical protein
VRLSLLALLSIPAPLRPKQKHRGTCLSDSLLTKLALVTVYTVSLAILCLAEGRADIPSRRSNSHPYSLARLSPSKDFP